MKKITVCKFGGSSVENAEQINKVYKIVSDNTKRKIVVVSAPGRESRYNIKITDHLFNLATDGEHLRSKRQGITAEISKSAVLQKFSSLLLSLEIREDSFIEELKNDLETDLTGDFKTAFIASRGEHYNARLINAFLNKMAMESNVAYPQDISFEVHGSPLNSKPLKVSAAKINKALGTSNILVVPGYYGHQKNGEVSVLSRGGSDLTGGEIASAVNAEIYENWTDTDGIYEVDPRKIANADVIPRLTFKEIRLLSSKGFNVFHFDAMISCKNNCIPINIRNTNKCSSPGTIILNERVPEEDVVGIARLDNMAFIYIEKDMLGETIGFTEELLSIFKKFEINTYHYPTDKDDIAIIVSQDDIQGNINDLRDEIELNIQPDVMDVRYNLSIISPVGLGIKDNPSVLANAASVLCENNINIEMLDQSPAQICFHIGILQVHADAAYEALYNKLILQK